MNVSVGEVKSGEQILKTLNENNIHWGLGCYKAFVLGSAKHGDISATYFFLEKCKHLSDELLLQVFTNNYKQPTNHSSVSQTINFRQSRR